MERTLRQVFRSDQNFIGCGPLQQGSSHARQRGYIDWNARTLSGVTRRRICTFNDNMQGTGAITLAAVVDALKRLHEGNRDKKMVISDGGDNATTFSLALVLAGAVQLHYLRHRHLRRGGSGPEYEGVKSPGAGDGRRSLFPRETQRGGGHLRAHRTGHSQSIHIRYVATNATRNNAYRAIRVAAPAAGHGKLSVRTRSGYIAGGELQPDKNQGAK
jgi:hypothetical protein